MCKARNLILPGSKEGDSPESHSKKRPMSYSITFLMVGARQKMGKF
jgi:hypothetical protein